VRRLARVAFLAPALLATACPSRGAEEARPTRTVSDAVGASANVPDDVRRVVTTVPGLTDLVVALGAGDRIVGTSDRDERRPEAPKAETFPTWPAIPAERVAALRPDLLLVDTTLSAHDLPTLRLRFPGTFGCDSRSLDGLETTFARVGAALGATAKAKELAAELRGARTWARAPDRPRVLLLAQADPVMALGPGSLLDDMLRAVGGENVAASIERPSGEVSSEAVRAWAPAWILVTGGTFPGSLRAAWAGVPAVRDGRVVDATGDDLVRAGPRTAKALSRLAALLTPEPPR
jgi:ABC-type Fe3+-hydroxamate transport system substrate-binding protein